MKATWTMDSRGLVVPTVLAVSGFLSMSAAVRQLMPQPIKDRRAVAVLVDKPAPAPAPASPERRQPERHGQAPPQTERQPPLDCPPLFSLRFAAGADQPEALPKEALVRLGLWLDAHPRSTLIIQGHADALGSSRYNWELSYRRAHALLRKLQQAGIPRARMVAQAVGAFQPLVGAHDTDGANRRVTLSISDLPQCAADRGEVQP